LRLPPLEGVGRRTGQELVDPGKMPTIRPSTGCLLAHAEQSYEVDQITNDIDMSRQTVEHYMRFKDQMKVAADGQKRLRLVNSPDVSK
jgi:hypothetical protein